MGTETPRKGNRGQLERRKNQRNRKRVKFKESLPLKTQCRPGKLRSQNLQDIVETPEQH